MTTDINFKAIGVWGDFILTKYGQMEYGSSNFLKKVEKRYGQEASTQEEDKQGSTHKH
jgi:hypothetical protein